MRSWGPWWACVACGLACSKAADLFVADVNDVVTVADPGQKGREPTELPMPEAGLAEVEAVPEVVQEAKDAAVVDQKPVCMCCPGESMPGGCSCTSNADCKTQACVDTAKPAGHVCAYYASQGGCFGDRKKVAFGVGSGVVEICVPRFPHLCDPCTKNAACQSVGYADAACVDYGPAGSFCGVGCFLLEDCPDGYECKKVTDIAGKSVQQCVVKGGAACKCSPYALAQQFATVCSGGPEAANKCPGKRACMPFGAPNAPPKGGLTACILPDPVTETCNGKDDDCDGKTDEDLGCKPG